MKITLKKFQQLLNAEMPAERQTLYKWSSKKMVNWLDRLDPLDHRGRQLWIDVEKYNAWADPRGFKLISTQEGRAAN